MLKPDDPFKKESDTRTSFAMATTFKDKVKTGTMRGHRRAAINTAAERRDDRSSVLVAMQTDMDKPEISKTEQLRDNLASKYSYPIEIEKPGEMFRQYTQEAMERFGNPENTYVDEESDFDQDIAEADVQAMLATMIF